MQGEAAVTECEKQITEGSGNLPALVTVGPAKPQGENAADVPLKPLLRADGRHLTLVNAV